MTKTLFAGSFDAEFFWRDKSHSKLPSIPNCHSNRIVGAMEELQFVFCKNPEDMLLTQYVMDVVHKQYLGSIGFKFASNPEHIGCTDCTEERKNLFQLFNDRNAGNSVAVSFGGYDGISPYAIVKGYFDFCDACKLPNVAPPENVVRKVNSKVYSNELSSELFGDANGQVINSSAELEKVGMNLLSDGKEFLIKDEFGVSGNGNVHVTTQGFLKRITRFLANQEEAGMSTRFLVEGYRQKDIDFSCQFSISSAGEITTHSIQQMQNNGFSFSSIMSAGEKLLQLLNDSDYLDQVHLIGKQLYRDGYFGPICLDSMVEKNGNVVPIIEINARKSMGLINQQLDKYLSRFGKKGFTGYYSLQIPASLKFSNLFDKLEREDLLFTVDKSIGFIPMSANCFSINANHLGSEERYPGRFYSSAVAGTAEERLTIFRGLERVFKELNIIYGN